MTLLDKACAADPQHPEAVYNRGLLQWRSGTKTDEQLVNELEIVGANIVDPYRVRHLLARVHLERGDADSAAALIEGDSRPSSEMEDLRQQLVAVRGSSEHTTALIGHIETNSPVELTADSRHAWSARYKDKKARYDEPDTVTVWELPTGQQLCTLAGHTDIVWCLAMTSDGRQALTSSRDGTVRVWDVSNGHCIRVLTGHVDRASNVSVFSVCPVPGRGTVLSAGADNTVREWDLATGACLRVLTLDNDDAPPLPADFVPIGLVSTSKEELCVSADRRFILCSCGGQIWVWDYATGDVAHVLTGHTNSVTSVCATPEGRYALSASYDQTVRVWDLATGRLIRTLSDIHGNTAAVSVCAASDGEHAITRHRAARVWEVATGRCVRTIAPASSAGLTADERRVQSITRSGDVYGTEWRGGVPGAFQVSRPRNPTDLMEADGKVTELVERALDAKADGDIHRALSLLQEARQKPGYERASQVIDAWHQLYGNCVRVDLRAVRQAAVFTGFLHPVESVAVTPDDGAYAVSGSYEGKVQLWDLSSASAVRDFGHDSDHWMNIDSDDWMDIKSVCVTPDGLRTAVVSVSDLRFGPPVINGVWVWDRYSGERRHMLQHPKQRELILAMGKAQRLVSSDSDRTVRVWNLYTGQCENTFSISTDKADVHWTRVLCVTPDGQHAVSTHNDGSLRLWELSTGWCVRVLNRGSGHVRSGCVTGDGRHVVTGDGDGDLRVWDLLTGECTRTLIGHTDTVNSVSITADDRHALSAGADGAIRVWDLSTGRCLRTLIGHTDAVNSVSIAPDGHRAVSGGADDTIRVWELDWDLAARDLNDWKNEIEPYLGLFLARCTEQHKASLSPGPRRPFGSGKAREVWTDRDFELLWQKLTTLGYRSLYKENVHSELHHLLQTTRTVDPRHLQPNEVKPYQAVILANHAEECAAANRMAAAVEVHERALSVWRRITAIAPEACRHDLVIHLLKQASWLADLRQPNKALEINDEAIRHCRSLAEPSRASHLSQLMHNHYVYLRQAKRRDETEEWLRMMHREFAASTHAAYLPGSEYPIDPADRARLHQDISTVRDLITQYENLPADNQHRLPGLVVSLCTYARLLLHAGEWDQALSCFQRVVPSWMRLCKQSKSNQCVPLVIGIELIEISELLRIPMVARSIRLKLKFL